MTYAKKLEYAGSKPFEHEEEREAAGEMTYHEFEMLTQDETYTRLAQVRWLANELEGSLHHDGVPEETLSALFEAAAYDDEAPLREAVDAYVDHWLDEFRGGEDV